MVSITIENTLPSPNYSPKGPEEQLASISALAPPHSPKASPATLRLFPEIGPKYIQFDAEQVRQFEGCKDNKFLNKRFIAHLFGDSYMKNTIYEGWFITDALMHMIAVLKDNEISPKVTEIIEDLNMCLAWQERRIAFSIANESAKIDEFFNDLIKKPEEDEGVEDSDAMETDEAQEVMPTIETKLTPLEKISKELQEAILRLEKGKKLVMPGGSPSHAVLYEFKRMLDDSFCFAVYNTGAGIEKHNVILEDEGTEKVNGKYNISEISLEKISSLEFLSDLFEFSTDESADFGDRLYDEILPKLEGTVAPCSTNPDDFMLIQRSGMCSWKMFSAYMRYNLPLIQRKYIKLKSRLDVFQKWYDLGYELDTAKISQELLNKVIVNTKIEISKSGCVPMNFSREELLTMGIYKAKKTFDKYKFLLDEKTIAKTNEWYQAFTGRSIFEA